MLRFTYIFFLINLFNLLNNTNCINSVYNNRLRNFGLRIIVFKEKKLAKILKVVKNISDIYYNKAIVCTADGINTYHELSDDERTLIETIISLCY